MRLRAKTTYLCPVLPFTYPNSVRKGSKKMEKNSVKKVQDNFCEVTFNIIEIYM